MNSHRCITVPYHASTKKGNDMRRLRLNSAIRFCCNTAFCLLFSFLFMWPRRGRLPLPHLRLPDSYVELYSQILARYRGRPRLDFETEAALSDAAFRLWDRTHSPGYRQESLAYSMVPSPTQT